MPRFSIDERQSAIQGIGDGHAGAQDRISSPLLD
jgi:hypothetical protein